MIKKSSSSLQSQRLPADYFTGNGWIQLLVRDEPIHCNVAKVTFEPGCRNHWHTHPGGQILIVTEGKGYVQKKGEPKQLLLPGDVVTILANEEHWHGATADSLFTHIATQLLLDGKEVNWLDPVTDEEYSQTQ
ncbi:MAG: betaupin 2 conserved barrel domain protein [Chitinophagaceae bacterium]|nr:betaupin 2 conserved barrel domain protein [Chitinophagaceae bacterium]